MKIDFKKMRIDWAFKEKCVLVIRIVIEIVIGNVIEL